MGPDFFDIFFIIKCSKKVLKFVLYTILSLSLRKVFRVFGSGYLMFKGNDVTQNYYFHCPPQEEQNLVNWVAVIQQGLTNQESIPQIQIFFFDIPPSL